MTYTLQETLSKLNISKYKFDKLRKYKYINPLETEKWNGMYYITELIIDDSEIKKLTPKKLEKIFEKIKREESKNLMLKWQNKVHRHNLKVIKNEIEKFNFSHHFESQKSFLNAIDRLNGEKKYYKRNIRLEENSNYRVRIIGEHIFDFWKNPVFGNNELVSFLRPAMNSSDGEYLIANVTVDIIEVMNKKDENDFEWFGFIKSIDTIDEISEECECCKRIVKIPGKIFSYKEFENLCYICYMDILKKEEQLEYRNEILNDEDAIILDFETASLDVKDGIVSISAINMKGEILLDKRVKPTGQVSQEAYMCHHLSNKDLSQCQSFSDLKDEIVNVIRGKYVIFAHQFHADFFDSLMSEYEVFDKVRLVNDIFFFENNLYDETLIDRQIKLCGLDTTHYKVYNS